MKNVICTCCPKGCHLQVDEQNGCAVTGNACPRGAVFGKEEVLHPVRTVTATVGLCSAVLDRLPVKTDRPIPRERMLDVAEFLRHFTAQVPVRTGDTLVEHVCGTDAGIVATRTVAR